MQGRGVEPNVTFSMSQFLGHAVYGIRRDGLYLYIGKTSKLLGRFGGHHIVGVKFELEPTDQLDLWMCQSSRDAFVLELELITHHRPKFNTIHTPGSGLKNLEARRKEAVK